MTVNMSNSAFEFPYMVSDNQLKTSALLNFILGAASLLAFLAVRGTLKSVGAVYQRRRELADLFLQPPQLLLGGLQQAWSWITTVMCMSDADIVRTAGFDALLLNRTILMGLQIFSVLTLLALGILLPTYYSFDDVVSHRLHRGTNVAELSRTTLSNLPPGHAILWLPTLATYLVTAYCCWVLLVHCQSYAELRVAYMLCLDAAGPQQYQEHKPRLHSPGRPRKPPGGGGGSWGAGLRGSPSPGASGSFPGERTGSGAGVQDTAGGSAGGGGAADPAPVGLRPTVSSGSLQAAAAGAAAGMPVTVSVGPAAQRVAGLARLSYDPTVAAAAMAAAAAGIDAGAGAGGPAAEPAAGPLAPHAPGSMPLRLRLRLVAPWLRHVVVGAAERAARHKAADNLVAWVNPLKMLAKDREDWARQQLAADADPDPSLPPVPSGHPPAATAAYGGLLVASEEMLMAMTGRAEDIAVATDPRVGNRHGGVGEKWSESVVELVRSLGIWHGPGDGGGGGGGGAEAAAGQVKGGRGGDKDGVVVCAGGAGGRSQQELGDSGGPLGSQGGGKQAGQTADGRGGAPAAAACGAAAAAARKGAGLDTDGGGTSRQTPPVYRYWAPAAEQRCFCRNLRRRQRRQASWRAPATPLGYDTTVNPVFDLSAAPTAVCSAGGSVSGGGGAAPAFSRAHGGNLAFGAAGLRSGTAAGKSSGGGGGGATGAAVSASSWSAYGADEWRRHHHQHVLRPGGAVDDGGLGGPGGGDDGHGSEEEEEDDEGGGGRPWTGWQQQPLVMGRCNARLRQLLKVRHGGRSHLVNCHHYAVLVRDVVLRPVERFNALGVPVLRSSVELPGGAGGYGSDPRDTPDVEWGAGGASPGTGAGAGTRVQTRSGLAGGSGSGGDGGGDGRQAGGRGGGGGRRSSGFGSAVPDGDDASDGGRWRSSRSSGGGGSGGCGESESEVDESEHNPLLTPGEGDTGSDGGGSSALPRRRRLRPLLQPTSDLPLRDRATHMVRELRNQHQHRQRHLAQAEVELSAGGAGGRRQGPPGHGPDSAVGAASASGDPLPDLALSLGLGLRVATTGPSCGRSLKSQRQDQQQNQSTSPLAANGLTAAAAAAVVVTSGGGPSPPAAHAVAVPARGSCSGAAPAPPPLMEVPYDDSEEAAAVAAYYTQLFPDSFQRLVPVCNHRVVDELLFQWTAAMGNLAAALLAAHVAVRSAATASRGGAAAALTTVVVTASASPALAAPSAATPGGAAAATGRPLPAPPDLPPVGSAHCAAIRRAAAEVRRLQDRIAVERARALRSPSRRAYIALFASQRDAAAAAQCSPLAPPSRAQPLHFRACAAPPPDSVYWPALWTLPTGRAARLLASLPLLAVLVFPVGVLTGALANLPVAVCGGTPALNALYWPWFCSRAHSHSLVSRLAKGALTGLAPALISLGWNAWVLPMVLYLLSATQSRCVSLPAMDRQMSRWFFWWSLLNMFLGAVVGGGIFQQLGAYLQDPGKLLLRIGTALPTASNFFMHYTLTKGLYSNWLRVAWPHLGAMAGALMRSWAGAALPRSWQDVFVIHSPPGYRFSSFYNGVFQTLMVGLAYVVTAPLIAPIALLFFLTAYITWRYAIVYVYERQYESGGQMFPVVFSHLVGSLLLAELFTGAVLLTNGAWMQAALLWASLTPAILAFQRLCVARYLRPLEHPPLSLAMASPPACVDSSVYLPPALREGSMGWYPESGKVWEQYGIPKYVI
ncbi:hypothetical protein PLESTB_000199500 [Pleodorina starrii]|uniref:CSC1/OSCA1-like 7TM region domain-containing protein n=1 Tax=Pleodorina starrii TaxID=330485 RepID=A0A9W6BBS9_9CHLO|nr:hypothetical protein PLESTM_000332300 [Pleodorina starrii]GLC49256.1 hypothetical protein PLESTB_000199500 [Pleodorina starrii]GLC73490.1 hypothetical protein PLESTF_001383400 [Pleodorina starrii]